MIVCYSPKTLPTEVGKVLYLLNKRQHGLMQRNFRAVQPDDRYYVCFRGKSIVGWAMTLRRDLWTRGRREVWFYIRKSERRKGHGAAIASFVHSNEGKLHAHTPFYPDFCI